MFKTPGHSNTFSLARRSILPFLSGARNIPAPVIHFNNGPCVDNPVDGEPINVRFMLGDYCEYETVLQPGHWARANKKYAAHWLIVISDMAGKVLNNYRFDPAGRNVRINLDSRSLGDTLAWIPQLVRYKREHPDTNVFVSHFWPSLLFGGQYPGLNFIHPDSHLDECYATYDVGFYFDELADRHPTDPRTVPLAKVASDILGMEYRELRPRLNFENIERPIEGPYVCIATASTANCKHWLREDGWQTVIDRLSGMGFTVVVIQKEPVSFDNVVDRSGDRPIEERIAYLQHCEFFIGLGSGLSWLAWALKKPVVLISGFSKPFAEFSKECYRVINEKVCNGCWNDTTHTFERGNWDWCPRHAGTPRQFECSKLITPHQVMGRVHDLLRDQSKSKSIIT